MDNPYSLSLFVFRRDLRLHDNSALIEALKTSKQVIPCFIFDPRQIEHNEYKSDNCLQFMANSLQELQHECRAQQGELYFFYGHAEEVIARLISELKVEAVFINRDYTPFSIKRDEKIAQYCKQNNINYHVFADALLHEPEQVLKPNKSPYHIFTPFMQRARQLSVSTPHKNTYQNYFRGTIASADNQMLKKYLGIQNPNILVKGGRTEALTLLKLMANLKDYATLRNLPAEKGTTHLSAHNKFGTLSIREFYHGICKTFGAEHPLTTELYWRDFFTHISFHYPRVFGHEFHEKYANLAWSSNEKLFRAWCEGQTGFPIVDAGMRELNTTGYMHNRVRMITASFLVKDLHVDWRLGEKYFAQKLTDYDPAVNNGNWQWAASTGCDAQPYFRIFNPWLQQERYDKKCLYIKRWIPELARLTPDQIHNLEKKHKHPLTNYPEMIVDHATESARALNLYKVTT